MLPLLRRFKSTWKALSATAALIVSVVGTFLLPPPVSAAQFGGSGRVAKFGTLVSILVVGLILVMVQRWGRKRDVWKWWSSGAVALLLASAAFLQYEWLGTKWTCAYRDRRVVIGADSAMMPQARVFLTSNPEQGSCHDLLANFAGQAEDVWTKSSIDGRCALLTLLYVASLPLFVSAALFVVHAVHCNSKPK